MNLRIVLVVVLLLLLALFAAINWAVFSAVDDLNLVFTRVQAPLGLLLLGFIALLTILYLLFSISVRTSTLVESRRYMKELEAARKVANDAEESRIHALRESVETEMAALREMLAAESADTRERLAESENVLTAHLGQIDDFLKGGDSAAGASREGSAQSADEESDTDTDRAAPNAS